MINNFIILQEEDDQRTTHGKKDLEKEMWTARYK